jgi:hypothetical protein
MTSLLSEKDSQHGPTGTVDERTDAILIISHISNGVNCARERKALTRRRLTKIGGGNIMA